MIDEAQFLDRIKECLNAPGKECRMTDAFKDYEEWDSLAFLSVMSMIDDEYGVLIGAEEFEKLTTLESIAQLIEQRRPQG